MPRKPNKSGDHYNDPFPARLRALFDENNLKQDDLTNVLGVSSRQSVTGYLDGSTAPTAEKITAIAQRFGVSSDWLLGLSDVRSPESDVQAVCCFTGLSESAIRVFKLGETVPHAINLLASPPIRTGQEEWTAVKTPLWQFAAALIRLEHAAIPALLEVIKNDPDGQYFDVVNKKESVELELFRFEKACREIPPDVFLSDKVLDDLNDMEHKRFQTHFHEVLTKQTEEAQHGEHTED